MTDDEALELVKGPLGAAQEEDDWVDLAKGEGEGEEVEDQGDIGEGDDEGGSDTECSFVSVSDNGYSDTTSVKKDKWRHRKHDLNDRIVYTEIHLQVTSRNLALKG